MYIPKQIRDIIKYEKKVKDQMGMSGSTVYMFEHYVLKIDEIKEKNITKEKDVLLWLKPFLPVPKVVLYLEKRKYAYLLMTKLDGVMTCHESVQDKPYDMIGLLAEGLKMLWNVPITNCPFDSRLTHKLAIARYHVEHDEVDIEQAEDDTYGEHGFKDPKDLLNWLETHQYEEELVFSHSDYCLPNVFIKNQQITGFIDFDRAGIADKWADIALCVRSIYHNFGNNPSYIEHLFSSLDMKPNWDKIKYYILLDELF